MLTELRRVAPRAFCDPPRPLAIGIRKPIGDRFASEYGGQAIASAMKRWCLRSDYLRVIITGAERFDLDGNAAGVVTEIEAAPAAERLALLRRRTL